MRSAHLETDAFVLSLNPERPSASQSNAASGEALCPQADPLSPQKHAAFLAEMDGLYGTEEYKLWAYENLGGAVRIPTESYDDIGPVGEDPRWETRLLLHDYMLKRFPLVHSTLPRTVIHKYALVYHWQGSDTSLKPLLLTAHQDVVPVDPVTVDQWLQPPYSGYFDGEWIWGRGSCDDKSGLIGSLTAIESLLKKGFKPARSIVLAYGIDEERGGVDGARYMKDYLLDTYGRDSFAMLVDEGGGYNSVHGVIFSTPAVAEKGKLNVRIEVNTPGGHSSVPPAHTGIGLLSTLITSLESHPLPVALHPGSTYFSALQCSAAHDPSFDPTLSELIAAASSGSNSSALGLLEDKLMEQDERKYRAIAGTTQAIDLIGGGVKVNALPERAWAVVDHRISDASSVAELIQRYTDVLSPVTTSLNLTLNSFGTVIPPSTTPIGEVKLTDAYGTALNPAPVTSTDLSSGPWRLLSGTILSTLATSLRTENGTEYAKENKAVMAPGLNLGIIDTRHYWNLTQHIFRYGHRGASDNFNGAHTVNEAVKAEGYLEMIRMFTTLILNADETDLLD
ncbi:carboxypeptidase S [Stereum hirsutum FP-91666 SS1]|uniref:carboxypeptidase S n=1 Tax=Stereum hirsutum (strain FP-91666) TaxID=721885 RepID=UPI000440E8D0|nr:carboxypeptidase S [Stereum hirsutum FP-91666 SS1]EIM86566.1 carboxypeptidase S [Stereum hirsutum FP-91666 SS1]